jgi:DNA-binding response OmpR family regulator
MADILIAEDDPLMLRMIEFKLKQHGFLVRKASNGEEALNLARAEKPALILLDGMMPIMDGFETLRRLKESPDLRAIPVVMLTLKGSEQDIVYSLNLGAADYIVKPFHPGELIARIRKILTPTPPARDDPLRRSQIA